MKDENQNRSDRRRDVTIGSSLGFGIGDFFAGGQMVIISTYISLFWTRFCSMDIKTAQTILGVGSVVSAFAALFAGLISDNFYLFRIGRRFGRRRFFILLVSPLLLLGIGMWIPGMPIILYLILFVIWITLAQVFQACYSPLAGEMTSNFSGRNMLSTSRLFMSTLAGTLLPIICSYLLHKYGDNSPLGYQIFSIGTTILFSIIVLLCWKFTWELTPEQAGFKVIRPFLRSMKFGEQSHFHRVLRILHEYTSTFKISLFRKHLAIYLLIQMSMDIFGQTFVYFVMFDWRRSAAFASLLLGCTVVSLPLMPLFGRLMSTIGPRRLYRVNFAGCLIGLGWFLTSWVFANKVSEPWWTIITVIGALWFFSFKALCGYIPWAVFPFIADVDQVITNRYRSATFSGVQAFCRQLCSGIVTIILGLVLSYVHFDSRFLLQPDSATIGLGVMMLGSFALCMIISWIVSTKIFIDHDSDQIVLDEIERINHKKTGCPISDQAKSIIESLTGIPYKG